VTPGISVAKMAKIAHKVHQYAHDPLSESFGEEAAEKLGVPAARVFKTLVISLDNKQLAVGIIPVSSKLSMKNIAKAAGVKRATLAAQSDVERSTGYVLGGVSPLGQKQKLKTIIDASAKKYPSVYVSAGRRGLEIELSPDDLARLINASFAQICQ
jgi:Cys-tRNA(Pro)/Cys-tRNA(Cys) deacylase